MAGRLSNFNSEQLSVYWNPTIQKLLSTALSPATRTAYLRSWHYLLQFRNSSQQMFEFLCNIPLICNFIVVLFNKNITAAIIASNISATFASYLHKLTASITTYQHFHCIKKILKGSQNARTILDPQWLLQNLFL